MSAATLIDQALELPIDERADLARRLLLSLESEPFDDNADSLWLDELGKRIKRMDNGESRTLDWRQAHAEIRRNAGENKP